MKVILLAAGVGRRFGKETRKLPKCLIPIDLRGMNLLSRYLNSFRELGLKNVVIVVGHKKHLIKSECRENGHGLRIRFIDNKNYKKGSILSLYSAGGELSGSCLIMDADVYFPTTVLKRLLKSKHGTSFLADRSVKSTGEEMMLMARGGRLVSIAKKVDPRLNAIGESVGFLKVSAKDAGVLKKFLEQLVRRGKTHLEYEASYDLLMKERKVRFVDLGGSFWTEMDFKEDWKKIKDYLKRCSKP